MLVDSPPFSPCFLVEAKLVEASRRVLQDARLPTRMPVITKIKIREKLGRRIALASLGFAEQVSYAVIWD